MHASILLIACLLLHEDYVWVLLGNAMKLEANVILLLSKYVEMLMLHWLLPVGHRLQLDEP
jgi:hypothetical protein